MLGENDRQEPVLRQSKEWVLKALREAGSSLVSEFYGLGEEELRWRPGEGEWSLKEIAAHARDAEEVALAQLRAIVEAAAGPLPAWDVDVLPSERDYQSQDIEEALAALRSLRWETTFLLWELTDADWEREADHPYRGRVTLGELAGELARHDLEHLWQVRQVKERLREAVAAADED